MGTWRYSSKSATRAVREIYKQNVALLGILVAVSILFTLDLGTLLPGLITLVAGLSAGAITIRNRLQTVEFQLFPEALSCGAISIPRHQVRQIASDANSTTVIGAQPNQAIRILSAIENYAGLCDALRAWAPPSVEWTTPVAPRWQWLMIPALVAFFAALYLVRTFFPDLILRAMIGLMFASPVLYLRHHAWPRSLRILASVISVATAAITIWILRL